MEFLVSTIKLIYPYYQINKFENLGFKVKVDSWVSENADKTNPHIIKQMKLEEETPKEQKYYRVIPKKMKFNTLEELMEFQAKCGHSLIIGGNSAGNYICIDRYNR